MSKIDLHIHTCYSDDGEYTPAKLLKLCGEQEMELIAITDHNSVGGVAEAIALGTELQVISGVELDCTYEGRNFHLLGYDFDYERKIFTEVERDIINQERAAAREKIRRFQQFSGIELDEKAILSAAVNGVVAGELIAEFVLAREDAAHFELLQPYLHGGSKCDMPNIRFYWDFFSEGKPAYVPIEYLTFTDAVDMIHHAGGIAVLAHPGQNMAGDNSLLPGIISENIDGIEAFSSYHSEEESDYYAEAAMSHNLVVTYGSDFHGKHKPNIRLGGHGAKWTDQQLKDGINQWLSK